MAWDVDFIKNLGAEEAAAQWGRIASRPEAPPGARQEPFLPVEVVATAVASLFVNHRSFGGSSSDTAPSPVPELARAVKRPRSSILAKMANLDGSRPHGAIHDVALGEFFAAEPARLMAIYAVVMEGARRAGVARPMPPLHALALLDRWLGTPVSGALNGYMVTHWVHERSESEPPSNDSPDTATAGDRDRPDQAEGVRRPVDGEAEPNPSAALAQPQERAQEAPSAGGDVLPPVDEARIEAESDIAELIVDLSRAPHVPLEVRSLGELDLESIDFRTEDWLEGIQSVQDWLRLGQPVPSGDPAASVLALAIELGEASWADLIDQAWPQRLTMRGLEVLRQRLERAVQIKDAFVEDIEGNGSSLRAATGQWLTAWEEAAEEEEVEGGGSIIAEADVWPISDIKAHAERGRLNLSPSYQRGDVWPTVDAQILMESILRGIPLPSIILLRATDGGRQVYEVIDGKQRLTAILRFTGSHPTAISTVQRVERESGERGLLALFRDDYPAFRKKWQSVTGESLTATRERELYFPFKMRSGSHQLGPGLEKLQGRYYCQIREQTVSVAGRDHEVGDLFETNATKYKLPLITYDDSATPQQIHEVFNLYNKQGKHLNAEEIRNARYHKLDLMRGLLAAAGDAQEPLVVAPFLEPAWPRLVGLKVKLDDFGFGSGRYQSTKVLSWVCAMLAFDSAKEGKVKTRSTSGLINAFLDRVEEDPYDPLRNAGRVNVLLGLVNDSMELHKNADVWADSFRNSRSAARWQELQLVASVTGVAIAVAGVGLSSVRERLHAAGDLISERTRRDWARPAKTQTAQQWTYIARVATELADLLGAEVGDSQAQLVSTFGEGGAAALRDLARRA